jgi:hypothetical protein
VSKTKQTLDRVVGGVTVPEPAYVAISHAYREAQQVLTRYAYEGAFVFRDFVAREQAQYATVWVYRERGSKETVVCLEVKVRGNEGRRWTTLVTDRGRVEHWTVVQI